MAKKYQKINILYSKKQLIILNHIQIERKEFLMKRHVRVSEYNKTLKKNLYEKGGICQLQPYSFENGGLWKKFAGIKRRRNCEMLGN